jgi:hypothetical protein
VGIKRKPIVAQNAMKYRRRLSRGQVRWAKGAAFTGESIEALGNIEGLKQTELQSITIQRR